MLSTDLATANSEVKDFICLNLFDFYGTHQKFPPTHWPLKLLGNFGTVIAFPALTNQLRADAGSELFICEINMDSE